MEKRDPEQGQREEDKIERDAIHISVSEERIWGGEQMQARHRVMSRPDRRAQS